MTLSRKFTLPKAMSACAYPDGMKVLSFAMCELKGGKIARQIVVQAWDE
jgi:hypothetical protein